MAGKDLLVGETSRFGFQIDMHGAGRADGYAVSAGYAVRSGMDDRGGVCILPDNVVWADVSARSAGGADPVVYHNMAGKVGHMLVLDCG